MGLLQLGDIEIRRVLELEEPFLPIGEMFPDATPEAIAPHRHWLEPNALEAGGDRVILPVQAYLVRTRHHTILIDTCIGCDKSIKGMDNWHQRQDQGWLARLRAQGVEPEAIDYVFCTHFHVDHCGWNTRFVDGRWVPSFPNAKYIFSRPEYEAAEARPGSLFRESVLPVMEAGQAVLVEMDHALDDEVWLQPAIGHTVGQVAVNLASKGHRAAMCGDLIHHPVQCAHPDWNPKFDLDPVRAAVTRRQFLDQHCDTGSVIMTAHFPSPSIGHLVHRDNRFHFDYLEWSD